VSVHRETLLSPHLITDTLFSYAVPDVPYAIDGTVTTAELNTFVNALLRQKDGLGHNPHILPRENPPI